MEEKKEFTQAFGLHLMVECYGCDYNRLTDIALLFRFLDECPDIIHMTKIMPPYVFKYTGKVPSEWGLSGFVLIAESHISIHTFPDKNFATIDIFSCKNFDYELAIEFIQPCFLSKKLEVNLIDRGLEYPKDKKLVRNFLYEERKVGDTHGISK